MASIVQRGKSYSVVYSIKAEGEHKQKWETYHSLREAEHRKQQVELYLDKEKEKKICKVETVAQLMSKYVQLYGVSRWSASTYESNCSLIQNYINPFMGNMRLYELSARVVAELYRRFLEFPRINTPRHHNRGKPITPRILESIHKTLHSAFGQAVLWEYVRSNPFHKAVLPRAYPKQIPLLSSDEIKSLLLGCDDLHLRIAVHLAFSGSLRKGEILALTWSDIQFENNSVHICKTLSRVSRNALLTLDNRDIIHEFPSVLGADKTAVVLKRPKTASSIRTVYLPEYVMDELWYLQKQQTENLKSHPNMMFQYSDGRPMLESTLSSRFKNQLLTARLPPVTFHSLRHSSITYKLILSHGNIKAVQGDSGHAQAEMVTELYGHILDGSRRENAVRFQEDFYKDFR